MKKFLMISLLSLIYGFSFGQENAILGKWLTGKGDAEIEISKHEGKYVGKVIWLQQPIDPETGLERLDKNNKDEAKQKQKVLGSSVLWGFSYNKGEYLNGKVYDTRSGKTYEGKLWVEGEALNVRGYLGLFFATEVWTKITE